MISSDLIPEKAFAPIWVTEEDIMICFNDEHPANANFSIWVTEEGIVIYANDEHLEKDSDESIL